MQYYLLYAPWCTLHSHNVFISELEVCTSSSILPPFPLKLFGNHYSVLYIVSLSFIWFCLFCFLDSTYKWYHVVFVFPWLISLGINTLEFHLCCHKCQYFILLLWSSSIRVCMCVTASLSIHLCCHKFQYFIIMLWPGSIRMCACVCLCAHACVCITASLSIHLSMDI